MTPINPIAAQLDANWSRLEEITSALGTEAGDHSREGRSAYDERTKYAFLLSDLKHDREISHQVTLLGMRRAPASHQRHHDAEGGLVAHLLQMWDLWLSVRRVLVDHGPLHPQLSDWNVWRGILNHDLNKVWKYKLVSLEPWTVEYAKEDDRLGMLLGDVGKVEFFLGKNKIHLSVLLMNALLTSEGGFSPSPRPHAETVLAKMLYILDELSANVVDRLQNGRFWHSLRGGISEIS